MPQTVRIRGIRAEGRHGASDGERDEAQPFVVDVEAEVESGGDTIEETADYREIAGLVRAVIEGESHTLIETLARRAAQVVAELDRVRMVRVVVHKPAAGERHGLGDVSAEASASGGAAP
ncbi:MAG TPA: dihydroneopterin aldolase [Actinomycetota bacterium]|nr:dihydroneopterin aldolase [Actinomycetota bacterium]